MGRVTDKQVRILREAMTKYGVAEVAAMKANMHRNTARKYLNTDRLPSDLRQPRDWRTRADPVHPWESFRASWGKFLRRDVISGSDFQMSASSGLPPATPAG